MVYDWIEWMSGICFHSNPGWPLGVMVKPAAMKGWHHDIYIYRYPIDAMLLQRNMGDVSVLELGILNP